jgi:hypothetical protein
MRVQSKQNELIGLAGLLLILCSTATVVPVSRAAPAMALAPPGETMKLDQVNRARWDRAWTNLVNDAEQTFTPSLPRLLGVEVELVVGNAGPADDDLTLTVMDASGQTVAVVTQTVEASACEHTMFVIPKNGIDVIPGQTYRLKLTGGMLFGWKYVVGGYEKGAATFNGKPLLPKARSTFLFRTYGAE